MMVTPASTFFGERTLSTPFANAGSSIKKNDSLQILRAIAALLVVYVHALDVVTGHTVPRQIHFFNIAHFGACGVDIFFAISGFLLSTVAMNIRPSNHSLSHSALDFLFRRFTRIFPIYWFLSFFWVYIEHRHHHLNLSWFASSVLLLPSLQFPLLPPLLFVGWTLVFEMLFYYLITLNLFFGSRYVTERTILTILALIALGTVIGFHRPVLILLSNPMNVEFTFGCLIGLGYRRFGERHALGNALLLIGTLLLLSTVFYADFNIGIAHYVFDGDLSWYRLVHWGVPAAMITAGVVFRSTQIVSTPARFGVLLGDASYSIYLISGIVLYGYNLVLPILAPLGPDANVAVALLTVTAIGLLFYRYFEASLTRRIQTKYGRRATQSAP